MKKMKIVFYVFLGTLFLMPFTPYVGAGPVYALDTTDDKPMDLNNTEWDVEMVMVTPKGKKETHADKLIFQDNKFISQQFEDQGYMPTNYSLTLEEDGTTKFGTMQLKDKETSFWKGEVKEETMDGSVHTQFSGDKNITTYFTGKLVKGTLKPKEEVKPQFPKPTPPPVAVPVVEEPPVADTQAIEEEEVMDNSQETIENDQAKEEVSAE